MNTVIALLVSAMSLLTQVQTTPNLDEAFKTRATNIAEYAISYAQDYIKNQGVKIDNTQVFGSTPILYTPTAPTPTVELKSVEPVAILINGSEATSTETIYGEYCTPYVSEISVKYSDGSIQKDKYQYHRVGDNTDHGTNIGTFVYRTEIASGTEAVMITSDNLSREIDFNVLDKSNVQCK